MLHLTTLSALNLQTIKRGIEDLPVKSPESSNAGVEKHTAQKTV
jgi:hypothetical protein